MNLSEHRDFWGKTFYHDLKVTLNDMLDLQLTALYGKPTIDIQKFDTILHEKYGQYEELGLSFNGVIKNNFGAEAVLKLEELFV
jgi:hypothetical protein